MKKKHFATAILISGLNLALCYGQSISGNIISYFSAKNLGYANVNIYKNDLLVANVLSDKNGDFYVKLDTGSYTCEIIYAGHKKITKEVKVTKDEKADFGLAEDKKAKYSAAKMEEYREMYDKRPAITLNGISTTNMWGECKESTAANSGKLTAGEINDFSKWSLWTDLTNGELNINQSLWNIAPTDRYTLQLKDQNGLPLANAKAELLNGSQVMFTGRTDNTGKAELWGNLKSDTAFRIKASSIRVYYNGEMKTINRIKKFENGINTLVLNAHCNQPQSVDIAIVMDATGSMQDEIDYLKFDLNDVIFKSKEFSTKINFRFANIFYRDNGDEYLTQTQDFTSVLSESVAYTNEHNAGGGGDEAEAVETALDSAINKLSWNTDTRAKILFLVLDASPHNFKPVQEKMRTLCYQAAEKGIRIVPITGSGSLKNTEYLMRCLALATNGTYTFLTNHSSIGYSHIKPSTDNYQVEVLNDLLVRVIKAYTYMPDCQQYVADPGVNLPDTMVVISNSVDSTNKDTSKTNSTTNDSLEIKWKFYPNPTDGIVHIVSNKKIQELYISDLSGKALQVIKNINAGELTSIDLSEYSTGIYLIRYAVGKQFFSGKIVLNRG